MADKFSPDQVAKYKEAFSLFDKNGDDCLPTRDLGLVLRAVGKNCSEAELRVCYVIFRSPNKNISRFMISISGFSGFLLRLLSF